jgi:hypothetical protein
VKRRLITLLTIGVTYLQSSRVPNSVAHGGIDSSSVSRSGSDREMRRRRAEILSELEMALRNEGVSNLVYDEAQRRSYWCR